MPPTPTPPHPAPIARRWTARATSATTPKYLAIARAQVLPALRQIPGFRGALILTRAPELAARGTPAPDTEIEFVTLWDSMEAIRAFAGADPSQAVILPEAEALLSHADHTVTHWQVALHEPITHPHAPRGSGQIHAPAPRRGAAPEHGPGREPGVSPPNRPEAAARRPFALPGQHDHAVPLVTASHGKRSPPGGRANVARRRSVAERRPSA
jgi:hypothetical protein